MRVTRVLTVSALALATASMVAALAGATTINACNDGSSNHASKGCATCTGNNTAVSPAASPSDVSKDASKIELCGRKSYVVSFPTQHGNYFSGTLTFRVVATSGIDLTSARVRVLARNSASCDDMGDPDQYSAQAGEGIVNCNGWSDLGTVDVSTTGNKVLTIPNVNSVIGDGYTRFLLVDASDFTASTGSEITSIVTNAGVSNRPVLTLN